MRSFYKCRYISIFATNLDIGGFTPESLTR